MVVVVAGIVVWLLISELVESKLKLKTLSLGNDTVVLAIVKDGDGGTIKLLLLVFSIKEEVELLVEFKNESVILIFNLYCINF